jgi:hypothetical protein
MGGGSGLQLPVPEAGKAAIAFPGGGTEVHRSLPFIGNMLLQKPFNENDLQGDMLRCPGLGRRRPEIQGPAILGKDIGPVVREFLQGLGRIFRPGNDLIVDVGDVSHQNGLIAGALENPDQEIHSDEGTKIADVGKVINRWAAAVDAKSSLRSGDGLHLPGFAVMEEKLFHRPC